MTKKPLAGLVLVVLMALSMSLAACGDATNTAGSAAGTTAATTAASGATTAAMTSAVAATTAATTAAMTSASATTPASATTAAMTSASATTAAMISASATTAATTAAGAGPALASCTSNSGPKGKVVVASKDFTESIVIAQIYADALEAAGIPVDRKMNLGATGIVQAGMCKGDISLYPEYTGTGLGAVLKQTNTSNDPKAVYQQVAQAYEQQFKFTWLDVAPFNDTNGVAVTKEIADQYKLKTLSDLGPVAKNLRFASNPEFVGARSEIDGLKSLQKTYGGFDFKEIKQVDIKLRYQALVDKQADACVAFTTEGQIAQYKLVVLQDDKNNFVPYQSGPVVRDDILAQYPNIKDVLNKVTAKLTLEKITALNLKIDGTDKQDPIDVAKQFLKDEGLSK